MKTFEAEMARARIMRGLESAIDDYWIGYERGLRRAHHGEAFGTDDEHAAWMALISSPDDRRVLRGIGYRDGLAALEMTVSGLARLGGQTKSPAKSKAATENGKLGGRPRKKVE